MEKTKTIFCSSDLSCLNKEMISYANAQNEIFIKISDESIDEFHSQVICLDLKTAIKFVKHLKKEIAIIKESEVING